MGGFQIKILAYFLAVLAGNSSLLDKMNQGTDAHTATGQLINEERRVGKGINFSVAFGAGAKKLAETIGGTCTEEIAQGYLDKVDEFLSVSSLKQLLWGICKRQGGLLHDLLGRRLIYTDINSDNKQDVARAERQAFNAVIQSTEASVMQHVTERVRLRLLQAAPSARILVQVHDELLVECDAKDAETVAAVMTEVFSDIRYLPLLTLQKNEAKVGDNWQEIH
jgi:DNA polymerase-1